MDGDRQGDGYCAARVLLVTIHPMRRRLFNIAFAVSLLLLCLSAVVV